MILKLTGLSRAGLFGRGDGRKDGGSGRRTGDKKCGKKRGTPTGVKSVCLVITSLLFASALFVDVNAHTPYGQWDSFRLRHLQVLTSRSDLTGDAIADTWVAVLVEHLPKSKAVVSRARNFVRMASLLKTDQAKLAVLSYSEARAMFEGKSPFEEFGPMPIQLLIDNGSYLLVARADLPLDHGYLLVATLLEQAAELQVSVPADGKFGIAVHPGASAAASGEPLDKH